MTWSAWEARRARSRPLNPLNPLNPRPRREGGGTRRVYQLRRSLERVGKSSETSGAGKPLGFRRGAAAPHGRLSVFTTSPILLSFRGTNILGQLTMNHNDGHLTVSDLLEQGVMHVLGGTWNKPTDVIDVEDSDRFRLILDKAARNSGTPWPVAWASKLRSSSLPCSTTPAS
jgi:hypothetical protein